MRVLTFLVVAALAVASAQVVIEPEPVTDNRYIYSQAGPGTITETCYIVNFDDSPAGPISEGDALAEQYAAWGVHISYVAEDIVGNPTSEGLIAFNTENAANQHDNDLLTPNEGFEVDGVQGIGVGAGGAPGAVGENSRPLGNVMILQSTDDANDPLADDSSAGGTMIFNFDQPVRVHQIGILDIDDEDGGNAKLYDGDNNLLQCVFYHRYGENAFENLGVDVRDVRRVEMFFTGSGATASLLFCQEDDEPPIPFINCTDSNAWNQQCPEGFQLRDFPAQEDIACDNQELCEEVCCTPRVCEDYVGQCPGLQRIPEDFLQSGCGDSDEACLQNCCEPITCDYYVNEVESSFCPSTPNGMLTCSSHSECIEQCCPDDCDCPIGYSEYCRNKRVESDGLTVCLGPCDVLNTEDSCTD